ncbi:hypothetical protein C0J52_02283 [Blattella germanica]|nr:hypothetical protein C0J52_02283 [Blattella germanica]
MVNKHPFGYSILRHAHESCADFNFFYFELFSLRSYKCGLGAGCHEMRNIAFYAFKMKQSFQNCSDLDVSLKLQYTRLLHKHNLCGNWMKFDWTGKDEDEEDISVWEDNWDDDNVEDDFSTQLRAELEKQGVKLDS